MLTPGLPALLLLAQLLQTQEGPSPAGADLAEAPPASDGSKPASAACTTPDSKENCGSCAAEFQLWQPCLVRGRARESATLPCTFDHRWEATGDVGVAWRVGSFHSRTVLLEEASDGTRSVHANFSGRVSLVGRLRGRRGQASVRIRELREEDADLYFCRVSLRTANHGLKEWQALRGTYLTVAPAAGDLLLRRRTGAAQPAPRDLLAPLLGAAGLLTAVALLGLGVFLARRQEKAGDPRRRGRSCPAPRKGGTCARAFGPPAVREEVGLRVGGYRHLSFSSLLPSTFPGSGRRAPPARRTVGETTEKERPGEEAVREKMGAEGAKAPPSAAPAAPPEESSLLYATLTLQEAEDETALPVNIPGRPGSETTYYAVLRH
ncbi:paired immunoglobulin-like type 2 receptor alpha isoform X2 [Sceloporus undulatus]|uniref:paired immunoglobulin-like type 2 receptor alpha isoform X2 n=1 Tax=Sceloporus undulatus TaxID=8520 RepID=UPI001C4AD0BF|nr:paired immunoglobulin-like type 2 receptor alpha isoform X2 [Sceloporus undulatus]